MPPPIINAFDMGRRSLNSGTTTLSQSESQTPYRRIYPRELETGTLSVEGRRPEEERVVVMCMWLNKILMSIRMVAKVLCKTV